MKVRLNKRYNKLDRYFPSGHLLEHISRTKSYAVIESSFRAGLKIIDNAGQEVWLSNSVRREYFDLV